MLSQKAGNNKAELTIANSTAVINTADPRVEAEDAGISLKAYKCYDTAPEADSSLGNNVYSTIFGDKHPMHVPVRSNKGRLLEDNSVYSNIFEETLAIDIPVSANEYASTTVVAPLARDRVYSTISEEPLAIEIPVSANECYASTRAETPLKRERKYSTISQAPLASDILVSPNECYASTAAVTPLARDRVYSNISDEHATKIPVSTNKCSTISAEPLATEIPVMANECYASTAVVCNAAPVIGNSATKDPAKALAIAMIPEDDEGYIEVPRNL